ncbi:hypothetical protein BWD10_00160 [Neisseria zoodegmatis]|uniref:Secreted protein n=1 Tax=Neisseria zoodegmatis TaxID=326523 RepID=A0ABX3WIX4_9NEIS|nr:hypothetical protein BWD10_00160 [Neisseria zoodegmatis]
MCAARSFAYLYDMSALAVLLRLELHPHLGVLQRSRPDHVASPLRHAHVKAMPIQFGFHQSFKFERKRQLFRPCTLPLCRRFAANRR